MAGICVWCTNVVCTVCVCARWRKGLDGGRSCGGRKSAGAQKQTNKAQAAVIKSSLVLVMHRNSAERQTALSFLPRHGQSLELVASPALRNRGSVYPEAPMCFHLSWHIQSDEYFGLALSSEEQR